MSQASLLSTLRSNSAMLSTEYTDTQVNVWLNDALNQHTKTYTWTTLPDREKDAVVLLSWIKVCFARASKASTYFSVSGREGSTNKGEIVAHNLELARTLREEYVLLCGRLGINPAPEIIVSDVSIMDESLHGETMTEANIAPQSTVLTASGWTGTTVKLSWTEAMPRGSFSRYELYYGTESGLKDMSTMGDDDAEHLGVGTKATFIRSYTAIERVCTLITDLVAITDYYFVVVLVDVNGRISVSNEVSAGPTEESVPESTTEYMTFFLGGTLTSDTDYISNVVFSADIAISSVSITLTGAPADAACTISIFKAASGSGDSFDVTIPIGSTSGSNTGSFEITTDDALFLRTGVATGSAVGATVVIGYE